MIDLLQLCAFTAAGFLVWLVVTDKFALLCDLGLSFAAAGIVIWSDSFSWWGTGMAALGAALVLASHLRQNARRRKEVNHGAPREIDPRSLGNIPGGKQ